LVHVWPARAATIVRGENRDTVWFTRLDGAWPARDQAFERWFDPSNFDEAGRQRISARETV
jgi:hypothetical protein